jgi:hypothetical protein
MTRSYLSPIRWLRAVALAGLVWVGLGGGAVSARQNVDHSRSVFTSASSVATSCAPTDSGSLCIDTYVSASRSAADQDMVCVSFITYVPLAGGERQMTDYEFGCYFGNGDSVSFAPQLASATVAPVEVLLNRSVCDENGCTFTQTRTIPVSAVFSAVGRLETTPNHGRAEWGSCAYVFHGLTKERLASAAITLDGAGLTSSGSLYQADSGMIIRCDS